eukprot:m.91402 g.91402  ORF g.91402 m.91402 type:complete len:493 (+) comp36692_c0_seq4:348-1826(+)
MAERSASIPLALFVRLLLVGVILVITAPIVAIFVSEKVNVNATREMTCFPTVPVTAKDFVRGLRSAGLSTEEMRGLLALTGQVDLSNPAKAFSLVSKVNPQTLAVVLQTLNVSSLGEVFSKVAAIFVPDAPPACHEDLTADANRTCCYFSCSSWDWYNSRERIGAEVLMYISLVVGLLVFGTVILVFVKDSEQRRFPYVIPYYIMITAFVSIVVLCILHWIGRKKAFCCGNEDYLEAFLNGPCGGSYVQVFVQQYSGLAISFWWLCGVFNMWKGAVHPHNNSLCIHGRFVHIVESVLSWGLPLLIIAIQFAIHKGDAYAAQMFCIDCVQLKGNYRYDFLELEVQITAAIGGLLLSGTVYYRFRKRETPLESFCDPVHEYENRHVFFFTILNVTMIGRMIFYTVFSTQKIKILKPVAEYFQCVASSFDGKCTKGGEAHPLTVAALFQPYFFLFVIFVPSLIFFAKSAGVRRMWMCSRRRETAEEREPSIDKSI